MGSVLKSKNVQNFISKSVRTFYQERAYFYFKKNKTFESTPVFLLFYSAPKNTTDKRFKQKLAQKNFIYNFLLS